MTTRRMTAVAMASTVVALLMGMGPAAACSMVAPGPTEQTLFDQADLVFEGVALASQDPNTTATVVSSADPITWTFSVEQVVKGTATATQQVTTVRSEATCGFTFAVGHRYRVYAQASGAGFTTGLFSGTREITALTTTTTTMGSDPTTIGPDPVATTATTVVGGQPLARTGSPVAQVVAVGLGLVALGSLLARTRRPLP